MADLRFEFDWSDPESVRGAELAATWASLRIIAGGVPITRILDHRAKSVRDSIYVPLYPLAEWIATNWWFLANEFQNPDKQNDPEFHRRHSLGANRDGYAYPDLEVFSSGSRTEISWNQCSPQWSRIEFLGQGKASIDASDFSQASYDLIDSVIRRLDSQEIKNTFLHDEWAAIQATQEDSDELEFCETAAALGWDPYNLDDSKSEDILTLAAELGELTEEAVQAINADEIKEQTSAIVVAVEDARQNVIRLDNIRALPIQPSSNSSGAPPWDVGYRRARELRKTLDLGTQPLPTMADLASAFGEDESRIIAATKPSSSLTKTSLIDGLVTPAHDDGASIAFRPCGEHSLRFGLCRAVGEAIISPQSSALLTRSNSERQKRNRAFAAEFLAPSGSLRERVTRQVVNDDEIDDIAEEFGVSSYVIGHQIENHRIAELSHPVLV